LKEDLLENGKYDTRVKAFTEFFSLLDQLSNTKKQTLQGIAQVKGI